MPAYEPVANDDEEESTDDQAIILAEIDDSKKSHINYKVGFCVVGSMVLATTALTGSLREVSEPIISELRETGASWYYDGGCALGWIPARAPNTGLSLPPPILRLCVR